MLEEDIRDIDERHIDKVDTLDSSGKPIAIRKGILLAKRFDGIHGNKT